MICDANDKIVGLLVTHFTSLYPDFNEWFIDVLRCLFKDELYNDRSDRPDYGFFAAHYSYYNRYAEKVSEFYSIIG